ncbi:hypothetical protein BZA70DRAFT_285746 [Myxozyma melibiosi]|uniref:Pentatricopeptide repeat protein n=1 Tax=Myxozyma melibiosi TaxID=54550 RepID=A0ABR1EYL3_9ASCO
MLRWTLATAARRRQHAAGVFSKRWRGTSPSGGASNSKGDDEILDERDELGQHSSLNMLDSDHDSPDASYLWKREEPALSRWIEPDAAVRGKEHIGNLIQETLLSSKPTTKPDVATRDPDLSSSLQVDDIRVTESRKDAEWSPLGYANEESQDVQFEDEDLLDDHFDHDDFDLDMPRGDKQSNESSIQHDSKDPSARVGSDKKGDIEDASETKSGDPAMKAESTFQSFIKKENLRLVKMHTKDLFSLLPYPRSTSTTGSETTSTYNQRQTKDNNTQSTEPITSPRRSILGRLVSDQTDEHINIIRGLENSPAFAAIVQIDSCQDIHQLLQLYRRNEPSTETDSVWTIDPDAITYAFMRRFTELGSLRSVIMVWMRVHKIGLLDHPSIYTWNAFLYAYSIHRIWRIKRNEAESPTLTEEARIKRLRTADAIIRILKMMLQHRRVDTSSFEIAVEAFSRLGRADLIEGSVSRIRSGRVKVYDDGESSRFFPKQSLYDKVLRAYTKLGEYDRAHHFFYECLADPFYGHDAVMYDVMAAHYVRDLRDLGSASSVILLMEEQGIAKSVKTYTVLIGMAYLKTISECTSVPEQMESSPPVDLETRRKAQREMRKILDQMTLGKIFLTQSVCNTILAGLMDLEKDTTLAEDFLEMIRQKRTSQQLADQGMFRLLEAYIKQGAVQRALSVYRKLPPTKLKLYVNLLDDLIRLLLKEEDIRGALDVFFEIMENRTVDDQPDSKMATGLIRDGRRFPGFEDDVKRVIEIQSERRKALNMKEELEQGEI